MTEKQKAYRREWQRRNKDKMREYRLNSLRRKALEELRKKAENEQDAAAQGS